MAQIHISKDPLNKTPKVLGHMSFFGSQTPNPIIWGRRITLGKYPGLWRYTENFRITWRSAAGSANTHQGGS